MTDDPDWENYAKQLNQEFGTRYTAEQIGNPDWCLKEMGRYGYSCAITLQTPETILSMWAANKLDPSEPERKRYLENAAANGGFYTYQLLGRQYTRRGNHPSPICMTLQQAAAVALYNILRLRPESNA